MPYNFTRIEKKWQDHWLQNKTFAALDPADAGSMLSLQGVKMGRPSHIHISIGADGSTINSVRVGGEALLAGEGTLYV